MRLFICAPLLLAACSAGGDDVPPDPIIQVVGNLENKKLNEASGLARSNRAANLYWAINDDGPPVIHALDSSGANLGVVRIAAAKNRDWEDIASFSYNGKAYLAVADIGDNDAKHNNVTVYIVEEPAPSEATIDIAWRIDFSYPNGALDAESLAVDATGEEIYVLSKRTVPAVLYKLPLAAARQISRCFATRVAELDNPAAAQQARIARCRRQRLGLAAHRHGLRGRRPQRAHFDLRRRELFLQRRTAKLVRGAARPGNASKIGQVQECRVDYLYD